MTGSRNPDNVGRMSEIRPETSPNQLLREWRERQKITRTKLAADLGISENYVWKIENRGFVPSVQLAISIEHQTGIPASSWPRGVGDTVGGSLNQSTGTPVQDSEIPDAAA